MDHAFNISKAPETVPTVALSLPDIPQTYYLLSSHIFIEGLLAWFQFSGHNHTAQCSHNDNPPTLKDGKYATRAHQR